MTDIVVETEDYRFTTDAWAAYTFRQIGAAVTVVVGILALLTGVWVTFDAISVMVVSTPGGTLIKEGSVRTGRLAVGWVLISFGVMAHALFELLWPWPGQYGERLGGGDADR